MDIENITIISIRPCPTDITSIEDSFDKFMYLKSEVECLVSVRNNDVAPLRVTTELEGIPTVIEAIDKIQKILFELS